MKHLKTVGIAVGAALVGLFVLRMSCARSSFSVYYAGGSAERPFVLAKHFQRSHGDSTRVDTGSWETIVYAPGQEDPIATIDTAPNPQVYGGHGGRVWLNLMPDPYLLDVETGELRVTPASLAKAHAALANGFEVARPNHAEFRGPVHEPTGALAIAASNSLEYVVGVDGSLTTWEDFVVAHPAPTVTPCKSAFRLCGGGCVKLVPDSGGGQRVQVGDATPSDPLFNPELVGHANGCVPTLGEDGPFVVAYTSEPGRDRPKDRLAAFGRDGSTVWSAPVATVFGDTSTSQPVFGVAGDRVVAGASTGHWWHVHTGIAGSVGVDGSVVPPE